MNNLVTKTALTLAVVGGGLISCSQVQAATFTFTFPDETPAPLVISDRGINLTLSNPLNGNLSSIGLRNILGGLAFSDTGSIWQIDFSFSVPVTLVSYDVTNDERDGDGAFFNLTQGGLSINNNPVDSLGTFSFTDTSSVIQANTPLTLQVGDLINGETSEFEAFAINNIVVQKAEPVPEPLTILGTTVALGFGTLMKRKKSNAQ